MIPITDDGRALLLKVFTKTCQEPVPRVSILTLHYPPRSRNIVTICNDSHSKNKSLYKSSLEKFTVEGDKYV